MPDKLSPAQRQTFDQLQQFRSLFPILGVVGCSGAGKSTILRCLHEQTGGEWISMRELLQAFRTRHPLAMEEALHEVVESALKTSDHVYLDDFSLFTTVVQGGCGAYPRANLIEGALQSITGLVEEAKKIISNLDFSDKFRVIRDIIDKVIVTERSGAEVLCHLPLTATITEKLGYEPERRNCRSSKCG